MIDKLSLTIDKVPDRDYLSSLGTLNEDEHRRNIYKYLFRLEKAVVLCSPHKFSNSINVRIPFTKIDINPKYFICYSEMLAYILSFFEIKDLESGEFNLTRIDIAVDLEDFPIDNILAMLHIAKIRPDNFNFYKGTIYAGSNPKTRIYNKNKEILSRIKKGYPITDDEKKLLDSGKTYTRFEIQIRDVKKTLKEISEDPFVFASQFDRLEIFNFEFNNDVGIFQVLYKYINRKFRKELEKYKDQNIIQEIKDRYINSTAKWFDPSLEPF